MVEFYLGDDPPARRGGTAKDGHEPSDILPLASPSLRSH